MSNLSQWEAEPFRFRETYESDWKEGESSVGRYPANRRAPIMRLKRILGAMRLRLSPQEIRILLSGRSVSLANRSLAELGEVLIRTESLYRSLNTRDEAPMAGELEAGSSGGPCQGCKGLCFPISEMNCICFGLLSINYCRRFRYRRRFRYP